MLEINHAKTELELSSSRMNFLSKDARVSCPGRNRRRDRNQRKKRDAQEKRGT
jgi:hypothetical protein